MGKNDFCCAPNCSNERSKGAKCTFHRIPTKLLWVRKAWLRNISRVEKRVVNGKTVTKSWTQSSSAKICGCHFEEVPTTRGRPKKTEREVCIPTIFSHKKTTPRPVRQPRARSSEQRDTIQTEEIEVTQYQVSSKCF